MIVGGYVSWAVGALIASTLLMVLVLLIRAPVRRAFGPNLAYALWLLPVLRLLLPPLPQGWREQAAAPVTAMGDAITYLVVDTGADAAPAAVTAAHTAAAAPVDWLMVAGLAWAAGVLLFLGYHLVAHSRFCSRLLRRARVDHIAAEGRVRVIETDAAHGPLAFGIWRKYVAFPRDFSERYDAVERDLALAHELGHHVRGDLIANWVALVVLALHWFNPVAWRAFRAFRADQEMACDALVLAGREAALRHAYGRAIVKSAHGGAVSAACHLHTINDLKGRLRMLSKIKSFSPARIAGGVAGVSALTFAALAFTASGTQAAERITNRVGATLGVDFADQSVPPAPPAPAALPAPQAAPAPQALPAPEAAPAPEVHRDVHVVVDTDGKDGKDGKGKKVIMVRVNGGKPEVIEMPDVAAIEASIPEIDSGDCKQKMKAGAAAGGDDGKQMVWVTTSDDGKKKKMVICTDRIEQVQRMAMNTADMAAHYKAMGLRSALMGLRHARATIEANTSMSDKDKAEALSGIDQAIAEVEKEADKAE